MSAPLDVPGVRLRAGDLIALRPVALAAVGEPALSDLPGGFITRKRGHGQEVADIREYMTGDDLRHLDRGSTARTARPHVRQFQEERDRVTLLIADFRPSMLWGLTRAFRSVSAAEALTLLGWRVIEEGGRVGLLALSAGEPVIIPARGRVRGMLDVIGALARAHDAALETALAGDLDDPPLDGGLSRVERIAPRGAELVIASGFENPGNSLEDRLNALGRTRAPRLLLISETAATRLPRGSYPIRLPDGTRTRVAGASGGAAPEVRIAGHVALELDAGAAVEETARHLAAAFPKDREP
ncbi:DUF58 domain-containing protein [Salipiger sp.]|uniref:DUF58 domain-containing protein n=1 Tax=Salipiger sp. TaxID=2078585 RepID=UPI003A97EB0B